MKIQHHITHTSCELIIKNSRSTLLQTRWKLFHAIFSYSLKKLFPHNICISHSYIRWFFFVHYIRLFLEESSSTIQYVQTYPSLRLRCFDGIGFCWPRTIWYLGSWYCCSRNHWCSSYCYCPCSWSNFGLMTRRCFDSIFCFPIFVRTSINKTS